jgi:hypothetical protein
MARKKRKKGQARRGSSVAGPAAAEQLRNAIAELGLGEPAGRRKPGGKRRHIDDYRELVLDGTTGDGLADALMDLTQQAHANRRRLLPEERPAMELPRVKSGSRRDAKREAAKAARDLRDQMKRDGVRERTHYYSAVERAETGEIDRTYDLGRPSEERP